MTRAEKFVRDHPEKVVEFISIMLNESDPAWCGLGGSGFQAVIEEGPEWKIRVCPICHTLHIGVMNSPWYCYGDCLREQKYGPELVYGEWLKIPVELIMPFYRMMT